MRTTARVRFVARGEELKLHIASSRLGGVRQLMSLGGVTTRFYRGGYVLSTMKLKTNTSMFLLQGGRSSGVPKLNPFFKPPIVSERVPQSTV